MRERHASRQSTLFCKVQTPGPAGGGECDAGIRDILIAARDGARGDRDILAAGRIRRAQNTYLDCERPAGDALGVGQVVREGIGRAVRGEAGVRCISQDPGLAVQSDQGVTGVNRLGAGAQQVELAQRPACREGCRSNLQRRSRAAGIDGIQGNPNRSVLNCRPSLRRGAWSRSCSYKLDVNEVCRFRRGQHSVADDIREGISAGTGQVVESGEELDAGELAASESRIGRSQLTLRTETNGRVKFSGIGEMCDLSLKLLSEIGIGYVEDYACDCGIIHSKVSRGNGARTLVDVLRTKRNGLEKRLSSHIVLEVILKAVRAKEVRIRFVPYQLVRTCNWKAESRRDPNRSAPGAIRVYLEHSAGVANVYDV